MFTHSDPASLHTTGRAHSSGTSRLQLWGPKFLGSSLAPSPASLGVGVPETTPFWDADLWGGCGHLGQGGEGVTLWDTSPSGRKWVLGCHGPAQRFLIPGPLGCLGSWPLPCGCWGFAWVMANVFAWTGIKSPKPGTPLAEVGRRGSPEPHTPVSCPAGQGNPKG